MPFAPPFDKTTSIIYDFLSDVFQNSKYLAMLRILLSISLQRNQSDWCRIGCAIGIVKRCIVKRWLGDSTLIVLRHWLSQLGNKNPHNSYTLRHKIWDYQAGTHSLPHIACSQAERRNWKWQNTLGAGVAGRRWRRRRKRWWRGQWQTTTSYDLECVSSPV